MNQPKPVDPTATLARFQPAEVVALDPPRRPPGLMPSLDALALLKALRRRWMLALVLGLVLAGISGPAVWYLIPPAKYTASATLHIAMNPPRIMFAPQESTADPRTYQQTQLALLKNRYILSHALSRPEVARLETIKGELEPEDWLQKHLSAGFVGLSEVLDVSLSGDRPQDLAAIVNAVVESYMTLVVAEERVRRLDRLDRLKKLWEKYQSDLQLKRKSLRELVSSVGTYDQTALALGQQIKGENVTQARRELIQVRANILKAQTELAVLEPKRAGEPDVAASGAIIDGLVERDPDVVQQRARVDDLARKYWEVNRQVRQKSDPALQSVWRRWDGARKGLDNLRAQARVRIEEKLNGEAQGKDPLHLAGLRDQISLWKAYQEALEKDINRLQREIAAVHDGGGLDLEAERSEVAITTDVAEKIRAEAEAIQVELDAPERIRLLAPAKVPTQRDELRKVKAGGLAALGALACALFGVSFWEFRSRRIDAPDDVVNGLGLRLVGALPALPNRTRHRSGGADALPDRHWQNLLVESIDSTRTMLLHTSYAESVRVVMVTSAVRGEGKTTLACHLATSLVRAGRRTLLVDCDLRDPTTHRVFGLPPEDRDLQESTTPPVFDTPPGSGLCEFLRGEAGLADIIWETPAGLDLLPAGRCDAIAHQVIARDGLRALFDELKGRYDFIVVDSAPVLPVIDTLLISRDVDGVVLSVLRDVSRLPLVYAAYERLSELGVKTLGAVVTGVRADSFPAYYSRVDRA